MEGRSLNNDINYLALLGRELKKRVDNKYISVWNDSNSDSAADTDAPTRSSISTTWCESVWEFSGGSDFEGRWPDLRCLQI